MNNNELGHWFLKSSLVLVGAWYIVLIYRFPFYLPYRLSSNDEAILVVYMALSSFLFIYLITSFSLYIIRTIRSTLINIPDNVGSTMGSGDIFKQIETNFVLEIRRLIILSILVFGVGVISRLREEEALFSILFYIVFIVILLNPIIRRIFEGSGDLSSKRWSLSPWLALLTLIISLGYIFINLSEAWEIIKQFISVIWSLFSDEESSFEGDVVTVVILYLYILLMSGITVFKRFKEISSDVFKLVDTIKNRKLRKA